MKTPPTAKDSTRRQFLKKTGSVTATSALLASLPRNVFAADDNSIRLAFVGCGNRGAGAVANALSVPNGEQVKLHAMADLHPEPMEEKHAALKRKFGDRIDVSLGMRFTGFDAYKAAIDTLRPGDIAMCTTRAYIRPAHVEYAVKKGVNVFMEKPFACDPGGLKRLLRAVELAEKNGVKIAAGLQCRHSPARQALIDKIRDGELGDIQLIRANRLGGRRWMAPQGDKAFKLTEQIKFGKIHLLWIGSGHMVDNLIHQIDECCWIKDAWPVSCIAMGAREVGSTDCGQNLDVYSMEYTFADGTKALCGFRRQHKARTDFTTFLHGTKKAAQFSGLVHKATVHLFKDQRIGRPHVEWTPTDDALQPWQYEWNNFIESIRKDRPHNEGRRAVYADYASLMGRAATHTGVEVTWDEMLASDFQFCDYHDKLDYNSDVPVKPDKNGRFPTPRPEDWEET